MSKPKKSAKKANSGAGQTEAMTESDAAMAEPSLSFEGALEQLETTVARLEEGELPLEEALELFESGVRLSRQCSTTLDAAEARVEILLADRAREGSGGAREVFEAEGLDDDEYEFEEDLDED